MEKAEMKEDRKIDLRIVLVGKTGSGKSATGNTILNKEVFHKEASSMSVTKACTMATSTLHDYNLVVVDTPGWCDTDLSEAEIAQETIKCIDMSYPGPHVFLLVVPIGRFTEEESKAIRMIQEVFGEGATRYTMILFTRGDDLEDKDIDDYLTNAKAELKNLLDKCGRRYHVLTNREKKNLNQVHMLVMKIQDMVQGNGGNCYTNTTYQLLDKYKRKEAEIQKQIKSIKRELQVKEVEFQWKIALMQQDQQRQRMRESELKGQLLESEVKRAREEATLVTALKKLKIGLAQEEERRRSAEEARQMLESVQAKMLEEQQKRELEHQQKMQMDEKKQQEEQKMHQLRMEEEELKRQIREYTKKMSELQKQEQQAREEKEAWLKRSIRRMSCCTIA